MQQHLAMIQAQLRDIWRYRWYAVAFSWLVCVIGWLVISFIPGRYLVSARIYVDTQSILRPLLTGMTIQPNVDQQLTMMTRTLMSRPNIERIVEKAGLANTLSSPAEKERLIDQLSRNIELKAGDVENLYRISYFDRSPEKAQAVVESLIGLLLEGNKGEKLKDTGQARRFLDDQIAAYERKLAKAENTLREFKQRNLGFMAGQDLSSRLTESASNLAAARLQLREAENARDALRKQLPFNDPVMASGPIVASPDIEARLQAVRRNLDNLRQTYTEEHPDVVGAKRILDQLEEQRRREVASGQRGTADMNESPGLQNLRLALAQAQATVASLHVRVAEYESRNAAMKAAAVRAPIIEAEYAQLNRDYEVNKQSYEKLLNRRESAQMTQDMDSTAGLSEFRVVDPPRVPLAPNWPNRPLLASLVLLVAVAGGLALAWGLGQLSPTFTDRRTLREATGLTILGTVTKVRSDMELAQRRRSLAAWAGAYAMLLAVFGALVASNLMITRIIPAF
jgi:polysaccharide chain length determinant protein (PEP-CTERM system associated)